MVGGELVVITIIFENVSCKKFMIVGSRFIDKHPPKNNTTKVKRFLCKNHASKFGEKTTQTR